MNASIFPRWIDGPFAIERSSDDKATRLRELGADEVVNYRRTPDWSAEVRRLSGGAGVQHVVEVGGGATLPQSLKAVAMSGEIGTMAVGRLRPVIACVFGFDEAPAALARFAEARDFGKIVIKVAA